jgi:nicotinate-nucleotide--dimethylbenzimidazole phosphoribosyltransferase
MSRFPVDPPARLPAAPGGLAELGRLAGPLRWLASAQGAWPPQRPALHVVTAEPVDAGPVDAHAALDRGVAQADAAADAAVGLVLAESAAPAGSALAAIAALLRLEPVTAVGTAGGAGWATTLGEVRAGLLRARPHAADPGGLLEALADAELSRLTGLLAQCAVRRTPVVLGSSSVVGAAALVAERLAPGAAAWWLAGDTPSAPGGQQALADLGLTPLLDLRLPSGGAGPAAQVLLAGIELIGGGC